METVGVVAVVDCCWVCHWHYTNLIVWWLLEVAQLWLLQWGLLQWGCACSEAISVNKVNPSGGRTGTSLRYTANSANCMPYQQGSKEAVGEGCAVYRKAGVSLYQLYTYLSWKEPHGLRNQVGQLSFYSLQVPEELLWDPDQPVGSCGKVKLLLQRRWMGFRGQRSRAVRGPCIDIVILSQWKLNKPSPLNWCCNSVYINK